MLPGSQKLDLLAHNFQLCPFLASLFVIPAVQVQATRHEQTVTFFAVLRCNFRHLGPKGHVDESRLFLFLAVIVLPRAVDGEADITDWRSRRGVSNLDVSGDVADEIYLIQIRHTVFIKVGVMCLCLGESVYSLGLTSSSWSVSTVPAVGIRAFADLQ